MTELLPTLIFYIFATVLLLSAVAVISVKNSVHAVFALIFAFFNAAGLFVLLGAEYLAMTLIIVYVGAVAVLFLFVVMMLDVDFAQLRQGFLRYLPLGIAVAAILLSEIGLLIYYTLQRPDIVLLLQPATDGATLTNTEALGAVLYTDYVYPFQVAGIILLVAMVGAIVLTLRHRPDARRQRIERQVSRRREDAIAIVSPPTGEGV